MTKPLRIYLLEPRGFCAGVERAIEIVEKALEKFGAPIYVRHEIVHNQWVVNDLRKRGVVFVEEVAEIPDGGITIFSAHGISEKVEGSARLRDLPVIDATCPLVTKVHYEAQRYEKLGREIILIGHEGHPEVEGTSGRVNTRVYLVQDEIGARTLEVANADNLAYVTQTTLSVDDTRGIIDILKARFPAIMGPELRDICYATQNRQNAVKALKDKADLLLVIGAANSSNSSRLRDLGEELGIESYLIADSSFFNPAWLEGKRAVGITAGASAPEHLVQDLIKAIQSQHAAAIEPLVTATERTKFKLPPEVSNAA
ncbi:MAG: 4-hydroxy-3-methylbut-2-enyl diphosphate reductase [Rickettsiales bacterium]